MTIVVCPLSRVHEQIKAHKPARIISLLDPHTPFPETTYADRHLRVTMHDITGDEPGSIAPATAHIETLLGFIEQWDRKDPLLVHCFAGISRSTATAVIAACVHNPKADEMEIARALRAASDIAMPNERMIALADAALGREGRLVRAVEETGRNLKWMELDENVPFSIPSVYKAAR